MQLALTAGVSLAYGIDGNAIGFDLEQIILNIF